jgi:hypothetical protein
MTRLIELSEEDYARLEQAAAQQGVTPAEWVVRRIPQSCAESKLGPDGQPAKTMADLFRGRVGVVASGGRARLSEDTGEKFADMLLEDHRVGRL